MAKFKSGNLVKLRSGGPVMTVKTADQLSGIGPILQETMYWCQWFSGKKLSQGQFAEDSLERADDETAEEDRL